MNEQLFLRYQDNFANEVFKNNLKDYMDIISGALNK